MKTRKKSSSTNKKVKNATAITVDGIKFKSKLEAYTYNKLKENGIHAEYESTRFQILDKVTYVLPNSANAKGHQTLVSPLGN